jgi:hypothetical protein
MGKESAGSKEQELKVEAAEVRVRKAVEHLSQLDSTHPVEAARKDLTDLRPHLEAAMEALENIERCRTLSDRERNLRHAFKMLLAVRRPSA